eukprot:JP444270.1.p3 GENE.JP444270.1~~JP444270.1.p3  ORF type:complete len:55 (-),score=15.32 JP444270.1:54-218(-)
MFRLLSLFQHVQMSVSQSFFDKDPKGEDFEEKSGLDQSKFDSFAANGTGPEDWD